MLGASPPHPVLSLSHSLWVPLGTCRVVQGPLEVPETGDVAAWAYSDISSRCSARAGVSAVLQTQLGLWVTRCWALQAQLLFPSLLCQPVVPEPSAPSLSPAFMSLQTRWV